MVDSKKWIDFDTDIFKKRGLNASSEIKSKKIVRRLVNDENGYCAIIIIIDDIILLLLTSDLSGDTACTRWLGAHFVCDAAKYRLKKLIDNDGGDDDDDDVIIAVVVIVDLAAALQTIPE